MIMKVGSMKIANINRGYNYFAVIQQRKDIRWWIVWFCGMMLLWLWDFNFLAPLSFQLLSTAIVYTFVGASCAVIFSLTFGWLLGMGMYFLEQGKYKNGKLPVLFFLNLIRSIPQIVWLLIGYILLTSLIRNQILQTQFEQLIWMAFVIGIFCSLEIYDLVRERISHFTKSDYFHAMLCCGMKESRIINIEILWKSSLSHVLHKIVSLFGTIILLQCSIDFIISVGLSQDVSLSNFPVTLGSLLAKLDSKQYILAVGTYLFDPWQNYQLLFMHLQGVSVAFIIVFTLICFFQIADGMVKQFDL